jgi:hypothetical protein
MAGMAGQRHSLAMMNAARAKLGLAIQLANMALADPIARKSDQTLAVIILLSTFEVCNNNRQSLSDPKIDCCR